MLINRQQKAGNIRTGILKQLHAVFDYGVIADDAATCYMFFCTQFLL